MASEYWCSFAGHWADEVRFFENCSGTHCIEHANRNPYAPIYFNEGQSIVREKREPRFKVRGGATQAEVIDTGTHGYGVATFSQPSHLKIDVLPFAEKYCEELNKWLEEGYKA